MNKHPLIDFFYFDGNDDCGRTLTQILNQSDEWLESTHDFIQWLFPLSAKSGANPDAPLIDSKLISAFSLNEIGVNNLIKAFDRMLKFYGLHRENETIRKGSNWDSRKGFWFTEPTHNDLRITRIISSLARLGQERYAKAFLDALNALSKEPECGFSENAMEYWKSAINSSAPSSKTPELKGENSLISADNNHKLRTLLPEEQFEKVSQLIQNYEENLSRLYKERLEVMEYLTTRR